MAYLRSWSLRWAPCQLSGVCGFVAAVCLFSCYTIYHRHSMRPDDSHPGIVHSGRKSTEKLTRHLREKSPSSFNLSNYVLTIDSSEFEALGIIADPPPDYEVPDKSTEAVDMSPQRKKHLRDVCDKLSRFTNVSLDEALQGRILRDRIFVDSQHQVLYCSIPSAASASWRSVLAQLSDKDGNHQLLHKAPSVKFMEKLGLKTFEKFAEREREFMMEMFDKIIVVRHPFERLVSVYRDIFQGHTKVAEYFKKLYGRRIIRKYRENPDEKALATGYDVRFVEFVTWLLDPLVYSDFKFNPHWATYTDLCQPCLVHYTHIIDFDTFVVDTNKVLSELFNVDEDDGFFPRMNVKKVSSRQVESEYLSLLSRQQIHGLYALYRTDFEMFNYTWPRTR